MGNDLVKRLRSHVVSRGGASIENGAWQMMLDAADRIMELEKENYLLLRLKEATDSKPDFEELWEEASNERDSLRAKLDELSTNTNGDTI